MTAKNELLSLLRWHVEVGADEAIDETAIDRFQLLENVSNRSEEPTQEQPPQTSVQPQTNRNAAPSPKRQAGVPLPLESPGAAQGNAHELANAATTLAELREAMGNFEGCSLKHTAMNLVFGDGNPEAPIMFIGEAPGADEDREGLPFVGVSGQLLDRMIAAIGLDRNGAYITNILPWRPPGNRKPTTNEVTICLPFIRRHIELVDPDILVLVGGTAASALLGRSEGITRLRGRWLIYRADNREDAAELPAMPIYHPAYLLRQSALKREAWHDLMTIQERLKSKD